MEILAMITILYIFAFLIALIRIDNKVSKMEKKRKEDTELIKGLLEELNKKTFKPPFTIKTFPESKPSDPFKPFDPWRKEIEQACISGGEAGVELAKDPRYKENLEVNEVDLEKEIQDLIYNRFFDLEGIAIAGSSSYATVEDMVYVAKHFFELGLKAKGE